MRWAVCIRGGVRGASKAEHADEREACTQASSIDRGKLGGGKELTYL